METNPKTCYVIGDPVSHSLSPVMHNAAYKAMGIESQYRFELKYVNVFELEAFMRTVRTENIYMLAVTSPHKESVLKHLDEIDNEAKEIGAINTIINKNGKLTGYNTDCSGAINVLKQHTSLPGKIAVVLGSGGTAKSMVYGLSREGVRIVICSRNMEEVEKLAAKYNCVAFPWEGIGNVAMADILINTTPVGRQGESFPYIIENMVNNQKMRGGEKQVVFDVNYNPNGIPLLAEAGKIGATVIDGLELLLEQGVLQFELYSGLKAPKEIMYKSLTNKIKHADTY